MILDSGRSLTDPPSGKDIFATVCSNCHQLDRAVKAPTLREIASIYGENPAGIVTWARKPGKKRSQFEQMPAMDALTDAELLKVAQYMLKTASSAK